MGLLLKIILFFVVFSFIFRSITRFLFGGVIRQAQQQQQRQNQQYQRTRPTDGNVNVDHAPTGGSGKKKSSDNFKGGDYIDYEEVS